MGLKRNEIKRLCMYTALSTTLLAGTVGIFTIVKKGREEGLKQMIDATRNDFIDNSIDNLNIHIPGVHIDTQSEYNIGNILLNQYGEYLNLDKIRLLKEERFSWFTRAKDDIDKQDNVYKKEIYDNEEKEYGHHNFNYPSDKKEKINVYTSNDIFSFRECMNEFICIDNPGIHFKDIKYIVEDNQSYIAVSDNKYLVDNKNLSNFIKAYNHLESEDIDSYYSVEYQYMDDLVDGIIAGAVFKMELKDRKLFTNINKSGAYVKK